MGSCHAIAKVDKDRGGGDGGDILSLKGSGVIFPGVGMMSTMQVIICLQNFTRSN